MAAKLCGDGAEQGGIELRADHCRLLRQPSDLLWQTIDAGKQQGLQVHRDIDIRVFRCDMPALAVIVQRAHVDQRPKDFFDEKRIAASARSRMRLRIVTGNLP